MSLSTKQLKRIYNDYVIQMNLHSLDTTLTYNQLTTVYKAYAKNPSLIYPNSSFSFTELMERLPVTVTNAWPDIQDKWIKMQLQELING